MDYRAEYDRKFKLLQDNDAAAKASKTLVGRYIDHPIADGSAFYVITKQNGRNVRIEHVDIGDGYVVPAWGKEATITTAKATSFLERRDALAIFSNQTDTWWKNRKVGEVVHYNYGFNQFVRGVIVNDGGINKMLPIALVGSWRDYDVVTRRPNGTISYGSYAKMIIEKETMKPNASNMVEYSPAKYLDVKPQSMTPISLELPEMDSSAKALASVLKLKTEVLAGLQYDLTGDASVDRAAIKKRLELVAKFIMDQIKTV